MGARGLKGPAAAFLAWVLLAQGARAEEPSPETVSAAIEKGVSWLKGRQRDDGSFGPCVGGPVGYDGEKVSSRECYALGPTAFALFTLAVCGVPKDDPVIERGMKWLKETPGRDYGYASYESSAISLMLTAVNGTRPPPNAKARLRSTTQKPPPGSAFTPEEWRWMHERVRHLIGPDSCFRRDGGFGYHAGKGKYADVSATQFGILALRAASFAGYPVEKVRSRVWRDTAEFLKEIGNGGFPYHGGHVPTRGMTAAGVSTLLVCREQLAFLNAKEPRWLEDLLQGGLVFMDAAFDVRSNPSSHFHGADHYHYCHLYAIERAGVLSGRKEFGGKAWYPAGAAWLLEKQAPSGSWTDETCMDPQDTLGTCFALLFLKRATPVITPGSGG